MLFQIINRTVVIKILDDVKLSCEFKILKQPSKEPLFMSKSALIVGIKSCAQEQ